MSLTDTSIGQEKPDHTAAMMMDRTLMVDHDDRNDSNDDGTNVNHDVSPFGTHNSATLEVASPSNIILSSSSSSSPATDNPSSKDGNVLIMKPWIETSTSVQLVSDVMTEDDDEKTPAVVVPSQQHPRFPPTTSTTTSVVSSVDTMKMSQDEIPRNRLLIGTGSNYCLIDSVIGDAIAKGGSNKDEKLVYDNTSNMVTIDSRDVPTDEEEDNEGLVSHACATDDVDVESTPFDSDVEASLHITTSSTDQDRTKDGVSPTSVMNRLNDVLAASEMETETKSEVLIPLIEKVETAMAQDGDEVEEEVSLAEVPELLHSDDDEEQAEEESSSVTKNVTTTMMDGEEGSFVEAPELLYSKEDEEQKDPSTISTDRGSSMDESPSSSSSNPVPSVDVASHLYEGVKGVWAWSKCHIPLANVIMGLTEAVASSVTQVTVGGNLQETDKNLIQPHVAQLDNGVLNPVIHAMLGIVFQHHRGYATDHHNDGIKTTNNKIHENFLRAFLAPFQHIFLGRGLLKSQKSEKTPLDADIAAGI